MALLSSPALWCPVVHGLASPQFMVLKDPHLNCHLSETLLPLQLGP